MAIDPLNPIMGQLVFDGSEFLKYIVDTPPGDLQGMQVTREGFALVYQEFLTNQAISGALAGIADQEVADRGLWIGGSWQRRGKLKSLFVFSRLRVFAPLR